ELTHSLPRTKGRRPDVGHKYAVFQAQQCVVRGDRLRIEAVKSRARDLPGPEGRGERGLIDDRASRRVDQVRCRLHLRQLGRANELARVWSGRYVKRDEVGLGEKRGEVDVGRLQ